MRTCARSDGLPSSRPGRSCPYPPGTSRHSRGQLARLHPSAFPLRPPPTVLGWQMRRVKCNMAICHRMRFDSRVALCRITALHGRSRVLPSRPPQTWTGTTHSPGPPGEHPGGPINTNHDEFSKSKMPAARGPQSLPGKTFFRRRRPEVTRSRAIQHRRDLALAVSPTRPLPPIEDRVAPNPQWVSDGKIFVFFVAVPG